jgi:hypothetical protein
MKGSLKKFPVTNERQKNIFKKEEENTLIT